MTGSSSAFPAMSWLALLLLTVVTLEVRGHGRLIEPPSRASMWRYGFDTPPDYNDHELYCGGYARQWSRNKGQCGVCGDAWDMPAPRPHEQGGKYGQGVITRRYNPATNITVRVELTANHRGYFEFRMCPRSSPTAKEVSQECLDKHLLLRADGRGARFYPGDLGSRVMEIRYTLPESLECNQCVFQWRYVAGNNWGDCGNGTGAVGCGPQEEFRACSDVSIGQGTPTPIGTTTVSPTDVPSTSTSEYDETSSSTLAPSIDDKSEEWWVVLLIIFVSLLCALTALALLYWYHYHAKDNIKSFLQSRGIKKDGGGSPMESPNKKEMPQLSTQPPPVPPRRVKKQPTFEGNLV